MIQPMFLGGKWFVFGTRMNLSFWSLFAPCFLKSKMCGNSASKVKGISQHHESEDSCGHCCRGQMSNNVYDAVSKFKPFDKEHRFRQLSVEPPFPCAPSSMEIVIHFFNLKTESQEPTPRKKVQEGHDQTRHLGMVSVSNLQVFYKIVTEKTKH